MTDIAEQMLLVSDHAGGVRVVTLNRPERLNAIDLSLARLLRNALQAAAEDDKVRAIVLAAAGKSFCSGADLKRDKRLEQEEDILVVLHDTFRALYFGPKPSIAALQGHVYGAGLSLALACDFLVGDRSTRYGAPFTNVGLVPDTGMSLTLPLRIGLPLARDMMLAGEVLDAGQAYGCELIDILCEEGAALATAIANATKIAERAPLATAAARRLINLPRPQVDAALAAELAAQRAMRPTEDVAEGAAAFREKRKPVFKGR
jgi:enoyl-CoA hydratase/carnithine racemase